jgi:hypothetical protein
MNVCDMQFLEQKPVQSRPVQVSSEVESIAKALKQMTVRVVNPSEASVKTPLQSGKFLVEKLREKSMGVACELCTIVVNGAKFMLENKVDKDIIFKFVEKQLCSRLGSMNETCTQYIELEGESILDMLEKDIDPAFICRELGLCLKVQVGEGTGKCHPEPKFYDLDVRNDLNCTLCKLVITQVKTMLTQQQSEQRILDYVNKRLCAKTGRFYTLTLF